MGIGKLLTMRYEEDMGFPVGPYPPATIPGKSFILGTRDPWGHNKGDTTMAKTSKKKPTTEAAARTPKPSTTTMGVWDFSGDNIPEVTELPVGLGRANNTQKLPFPWDHYAAKIKLAKPIPVTLDFWITGRGYKAEDCTPKKCRERIQRAFYGWKSAKAHKKDREKFSLGFSDQYDPKTKEYTGTNMYFQVAKPQ